VCGLKILILNRGIAADATIGDPERTASGNRSRARVQKKSETAADLHLRRVVGNFTYVKEVL